MDSTAVKHELYFGDLLRLDFQLSDNCVPVTGATVTAIIKRTSDNKYWDGDSWEVGTTNLAVAEYDATNEPGYYVYSLTPASQADTIIVSVKYDNGVSVRYETQTFLIKDRVTEITSGLSSEISTAFTVLTIWLTSNLRELMKVLRLTKQGSIR